MQRIAVVDDVKVNVLLVQGYLKALEDVQVFGFTRPEEAMAWCQEFEPDLIVIDYQMPELNGLQFARQIRTDRRMKETPLIMVTGEERSGMIYDVLNLGFTDFLKKPVDRLELLARARNMLALRSRQREAKVLTRKLTRLSTTDALTSLLNRRAFFELVEGEIEAAAKGSTTFSFAILDLDRFKSINDRFGHNVGDEVLQAVAARLSSGTEHPVGRIGGEEFCVLFRSTTNEDAVKLCNRLLEDVRAQPIRCTSGDIACTLSAGLATWHAEFNAIGDIYIQADKALYRAKQNGRDRLELACSMDLAQSA